MTISPAACRVFAGLALAAVAPWALAALPAPPAPTPEAKAKAAEAAARTAWTAKVENYKLCEAQDRAAANYRAGAAATGKPVPPAVPTPPCSDPGPYAAAPPQPLEGSGAHSPPETAATPPSSAQPAAAAPKQQ